MPRTMRKFSPFFSPGILFNAPDGADGGDGSGGGGAGGSSDSGDKGSGADSGDKGSAGSTDKGYPENTPVAEMTLEQQVAYYKTTSRKHEDRVKAIGLTPEQVKELRDKATRHDALERELMSDKDKAVAEARDTAKAEARAELIPSLVSAEFRAAAGDRIEADRMATILEPLDLSKFVTDSGVVDTAKVAAFVDGVAPATGDGHQQSSRGPSSSGQGRRDSSARPSVASGREMYRAQRKS